MLPRHQISVTSQLRYHTRVKVKRKTCCTHHGRIANNANVTLSYGAKWLSQQPYTLSVRLELRAHTENTVRGPSAAQEADENNSPGYAVMVLAQVGAGAQGYLEVLQLLKEVR